MRVREYAATGHNGLKKPVFSTERRRKKDLGFVPALAGFSKGLFLIKTAEAARFFTISHEFATCYWAYLAIS